jgi:hypothetical protein
LRNELKARGIVETYVESDRPDVREASALHQRRRSARQHS